MSERTTGLRHLHLPTILGLHLSLNSVLQLGLLEQCFQIEGGNVRSSSMRLRDTLNHVRVRTSPRLDRENATLVPIRLLSSCALQTCAASAMTYSQDLVIPYEQNVVSRVMREIQIEISTIYTRLAVVHKHQRKREDRSQFQTLRHILFPYDLFPCDVSFLLRAFSKPRCLHHFQRYI